MPSARRRRVGGGESSGRRPTAEGRKRPTRRPGGSWAIKGALDTDCRRQIHGVHVHVSFDYHIPFWKREETRTPITSSESAGGFLQRSLNVAGFGRPSTSHPHSDSRICWKQYLCQLQETAFMGRNGEESSSRRYPVAVARR